MKNESSFYTSDPSSARLPEDKFMPIPIETLSHLELQVPEILTFDQAAEFDRAQGQKPKAAKGWFLRPVSAELAPLGIPDCSNGSHEFFVSCWRGSGGIICRYLLVMHPTALATRNSIQWTRIIACSGLINCPTNQANSGRSN